MLSVSNLKQVDFNNALSVDYYAFGSCVNLSTANISSVEVLMPLAFYNSGITGLYLPNLKCAGPCVFDSCFNLSNISGPIDSDTVEIYDEHNNRSVSGCVLISDYEFGGEHFEKSVVWGSIRNCVDVKLPDSAKMIEQAAFEYCRNLQRIDCGKVSVISSLAFKNCEKLHEAVLSGYDGVVAIQYPQESHNIFRNCDVPVNVYVKDEQAVADYLADSNWKWLVDNGQAVITVKYA